MKMLVSLGGNALGTDPIALRESAETVAGPIVALLQQGHQIVLCHGNGAQVGMLKTGLDAARDADRSPDIPLFECVAFTQSYIGHNLQTALENRMREVGVDGQTATLVTRVAVDENDPSFQEPTKPIGAFYSEEQAEALRKLGKTVKQDAGRGFREVVASPLPLTLCEKDIVRDLVDRGVIVIAGGGGGIPVVSHKGMWREVDAVIDKDHVSAALAMETDCELLVILTGVDAVKTDFGKPEEARIEAMSAKTAQALLDEGEFWPGSMLPKIGASIRFASSARGRRVLITALETLAEGLAGETGTWIHHDDDPVPKALEENK